MKCSGYRCGKKSPRKEVGKMAYLVLAIVFIVLALSAVRKPHTGHA